MTKTPRTTRKPTPSKARDGNKLQRPRASSGSRIPDETIKNHRSRVAALGIGSDEDSHDNEEDTHVDGPATDLDQVDDMEEEEKEEEGEGDLSGIADADEIAAEAAPGSEIGDHGYDSDGTVIKSENEDEGDLDEFSFALDNPPHEIYDEKMPLARFGSTIKTEADEALDAFRASIFIRLNGAHITLDPLADPEVEFARLLQHNQFLALFNLQHYTFTDRVFDPQIKALAPRAVINAIVTMFLSAGYISRIKSHARLEAFDVSEMVAAGMASYQLLTLILKKRVASSDPRANTQEKAAGIDPEPVSKINGVPTAKHVEAIMIGAQHRQEAEIQRARVQQLEEELRSANATIEAATKRIRDAEVKATSALPADAKPSKVKRNVLDLRRSLIEEALISSEEDGSEIGVDPEIDDAEEAWRPPHTGRKAKKTRRSTRKAQGSAMSRRSANGNGQTAKTLASIQGLTMPAGIPPPFIPSAMQDVIMEDKSDIFDGYEPAPRAAASARYRGSAISDLKTFTNKDKSEARARNWLSSVKAAFRRDELTADQMCMEFPTLLEGPAKNWYRQLKTSIKATWKNLVEEFQAEFCGDAISPLHKYYEMRRMPTEDFVDYLFRLNAQARRANHDYDFGIKAREHVQQYLNSVQDRDLVRTLTPLCIRDVDTLKEVLVAIRRAEERKKISGDDDPRSKGSKRTGDRRQDQRSAKTASGDRPKARIQALTQKVKKTRVADARGADRRLVKRYLSAVDSDDGSSDEDLRHDSSAEDHSSSDEEYRSEIESQSEASLSDIDKAPELSKSQRSQLKRILRAFVVSNEAKIGDPKGASLKNRSNIVDQEEPCTHCGSQKHRDLDCWRRLTCEHCGRRGHPSDHCFRLCMACGKIHDRGKCPIEEMVNRIRIWYKPSQHAGILPPDVEKWLNEIAC